MYKYKCDKGHKQTSPIRATFVSCGKCNKNPKTSKNLNEMKEVK